MARTEDRTEERTTTAKPPVLRRHGLVGFFVDAVLAAVAWATGWQPVEAFVRAHVSMLPWSLTALHVVMVPFFFLQTLGGHSRSADLLSAARSSVDERLEAWSTPFAICASFIVPGVLAMPLRSSHGGVRLMLAVFGPFGGIALIVGLVWALHPREFPIPDAFATAPRRAVVALAVALYLVLMEITMVLAAESQTVFGGVFPFLGALLSYLPVRLYLFYATATNRAERLSVFLSFGSLLLRLATV